MSTTSPPDPCPPRRQPQPTTASQSLDARQGLHALCAVELCERFAASLFGSLLLLYLNERLGLALRTATRWSGSFNAAVYLSSVLGGVVADAAVGKLYKQNDPRREDAYSLFGRNPTVHGRL